MKLKKKNVVKILILIVIVIGLFFGYKIYKKNYEICSYKWVKEEKSYVGQYRLYVNDKNGKHVDGSVMLTYLNGKVEYVNVSSKGNLYIKKTIKKVSNPRRK